MRWGEVSVQWEVDRGWSHRRAGRLAAQDIQAAWLAGCGRHRFSRVCVAASAALLPEDGKEKAAPREEPTESRRLLQGQEEEQLRDGGRAGTARITQDVNIQVGRKGRRCWGLRPGRARVASQGFPGSDHGPGTRWAGLSHFWEKEGVRKGLGSLEQCGSGNEDARASLTPGQTRRDPHLPACQVEKGKHLDLEERFDALRREHTETLQGACQDSRAPCSHPAHSPRTAGAPPAPCRVVGMLPLLLRSTVGLRWGLLAQCPRTGDAQFMSPLAELQRAHEQEKLLLAESHHRSQAALQVPVEKYLGRGCSGRA